MVKNWCVFMSHSVVRCLMTVDAHAGVHAETDGIQADARLLRQQQPTRRRRRRQQ